MSKLIFTLNRDWIEEKKKEYGNPIRKMERVIRAFGDAKLEKSDYDSLTVELPEEKREVLSQKVAAFVSETFGEKEPWSIMQLGGDVRDMEVPAADAVVDPFGDPEPQSEHTEEHEHREESIEEVISKAEAMDAGGVGAEEQEPTGEAPDKCVAEVTEEEIDEMFAELERRVQEADEAEAAKAAEDVKTVSAKAKSVIEEICKTVPMCYSPELSAYIKELGQVIPMLGLMRAKECLWSQSLLVAIDKGCGFSSFLSGLARLYHAFELVEKGDASVTVKEIVIENSKGQDNKYADWKNALNRAQEFQQQNQRRSQKIILAMDISQWQAELTSTAVLDYLRQIYEVSTNFTCVFRVPFMEQQVIRNIEEALADVMTVKTLVAAPIPIDNMVDYMKEQLEKMGCSAGDDCDSVMERWIIREKSDDSFFGYKSLDKMVKALVYHKALLNSANGIVKRQIEAADIESLLDEPDELADPRELLERLIGMADVKRRIEEIVIQIKTQKELAAQGKSLERPCIHMMFTGNPGTGKTTVARILARLMKEEEVLRKGYFYEITGRSLCGRYVGETAPKTSTYCRDAYGSVLFIDEAYSLNQGNGNDYGKEAIQTLIAEMENHRDDFCVILAGYQEEMEELLTVNPGLESRIPYVLHFPNYSRDELEQIFFAMMDGNFEYGDSLKETVHNFFDSIPDSVMEDETFSNARLVRNLFERAWGKAAYRRSLDGDKNAEKGLEIRSEDLLSASEEEEFKKLLESNRGHKHIGFVTG